MTLGLDKSVVIVLEALRKQRNVSDYEGNPVSDEAVIECIQQAEQLLQYVLKWIKANRADLMPR